METNAAYIKVTISVKIGLSVNIEFLYNICSGVNELFVIAIVKRTRQSLSYFDSELEPPSIGDTSLILSFESALLPQLSKSI